MKKFNQTITVEIEVDEIANRFLATIKEDEAHRDIIAEAVIGNLLNKGRISKLYSALNGFITTIDFAIGQVITCTKRTCDYFDKADDSNYRPVGVCKIIGIDEYGDNPIQIEYQTISKQSSEPKGYKIRTETTWVSMKECTGVEPGTEISELVPLWYVAPKINLSKVASVE